MSFGTAYFAPAPLGRDMFMVPKLESDPREFYVDDEKDLSAQDGAYLHVERAAPGAKQPLDRMRLNRILNGEQQQQQGDHTHPHHHQDGADQYQQQQQGYPYHDHSPTMQSFHSSTGPIPVSTFPVSPVASLSPMTSSSDGSPVPAGMAPTLATMSSPLSPMTSFPTMSQPTLMFDDVMPYSYNIPQYHTTQAYPFKHAGNAKPMDSPAFGTEAGNSSNNNSQGHSPQTHHYSSQESDHSDSSPTVLSAFPPTRAMNSLVDHSSYSMPDSPPYSSSSFYHSGQNQIPSPYSVGSHSPISNGPYFTAYGTPSNFTPTPPTTPPYGYSHTTGADGSRYPGGPMPMYADHHFSMPTSQQPTNARASRPSGRGGRKAPYEPRAARSSEGNANGVTPAPRRFQCHECEKAFPTKGELASHSRCHLTVPAFMCGICGRPFKRRTDYVRHVRNVHEEVGRYSCAQCGERFGRLDKLKRHDKHGCGNEIKDGSDV
ncbi:hypothetical protein BG015_003867 [Linnemannia schmuckeri]|uniref:C2H2-type domain-containing protein n=1 Tax=Linnemannia schmuckeri TaxID=64567 RepID=A0A9P5V2A9_9FUNG|nr:hypothetical protein BG015_003867 [Linnemannia schmuckeri]